MVLFNTVRKPLLKFSEKREAKQQRINEYKSLLSLMSSTGMVVYEGIPYRSIADFTIEFFKNLFSMEEQNKEREEALTTLSIEPIEVEPGVYAIAPEREEVINE